MLPFSIYTALSCLSITHRYVRVVEAKDLDYKSPIMANSSINARTVKCQECQRTFRTATAAARTCQECQRMPSTQASRPSLNSRQATQSADKDSIPSEYLQLLDSRIADLEHAAEASRCSGQSAADAEGTDRLARPSSFKPVIITPYMTHSTRSSDQRTSPRQPQASSIVMERFLADKAEPDGV